MKTISLAITSLLLLTGCASPSNESAGIVVSSQNYANIATSLMGDNPDAQFDVHVLLSSDAIDPHEFEPSAKDKLAISQAEAVFYAGTDFDAFVDPLLDSVNFDPDFVINSSYFVREKLASCATELCLEKGSNPHLWFDLDTISSSAKALTDLYIKLRPEHKLDYEKAEFTFQSQIKALKAKQDSVAERLTSDITFFAPEAIANVLLLELGIKSISSETIANKIANEVELSILEMQEIEELLKSRAVKIFAANQQVESQQAQQLLDIAQSASTPVIYFSESSLCVNKSDKFLECFDKKIEEVIEKLGLKLD